MSRSSPMSTYTSASSPKFFVHSALKYVDRLTNERASLVQNMLTLAGNAPWAVMLTLATMVSHDRAKCSTVCKWVCIQACR